MDVFLELKLNQKWIYYLAYTNVANENCVKFCMKEVFNVGKGEWCDEMKDGKSSSLGMPMSPQEISKKYKRRSLGMPKAPPSSSTKYQVIFQDTIFLLLHILCVILGASLFLFSVFFFFVFCNKWLDPIILLLEKTHSVFIAQNTLVLTLIVVRVFTFC
jgi:hypothetical protein